jgi:predicted nuclease with TOPRIM domain
MSSTFDVQFKSLEANVQRLIEHVKILKNENIRLKNELNEKEVSLSRMYDKLNELEQQYKLLQISRTLTKCHENDLKLTNQKINSLVREIDQCIALLTKV